ncbi:glycosyltransferase family 87 protein [Kitasatospora sp. CB01950]|uniref:glycosyltransferase family 87 protein n=1 Tax=Kitasatospora sp. CB01950 TaxID=1703930 RepID=UPI000AF59927|nr:glycosyltransferase family 87 protein [Kitasatospora sp. CB01950]
MSIRRASVPDPGPWLRARASAPAVAAAAVMLGVVVFDAHRSGINTMDNAFVVKAAQTFLDGGSPYADRRFLYLPSSVLFAVPPTLLSEEARFWLVPAGTAALVVAGWFLALRLFRVPCLSRLGVLGVLFLCFFGPFRNLVQLGNWTACSVAALPAALVPASRGRWVRAGLVVGVALAVKPMLLPLTLLFLFARRPKAFLAAAAVPLATAGAAAALMPEPGLFVTRTLPFLLRGQDSFAKPYDASLTTLLPRVGVPERLALAVAGLLALALLVGAWRRWRAGGDEGLRLAETAAMLMAAACLAGRPAFDHYLLVLLPVLAASVVRAGSVARSPWLWIALIPRMAGFELLWVDAVEHWAYSVAAVNLTVAALLLRRVARPVAGGPGGVRPTGFGADLPERGYVQVKTRVGH